MTYLTREQKGVLLRHEIERIFEQRIYYLSQIEKLKGVGFVGDKIFREICADEIAIRQKLIEHTDIKLMELRKELGIETPTIHTEL
jgi:hypothetical protein